MKKKLVIGTVIALVFALGACEVPEDDGTTHAERVVKEQQAAQSKDKPSGEVKEANEPEAPQYSVAQENAIALAADYLDYSAYSRSGLIDQLKYEGFSAKDATFAVDHIKVDWKVQAAASAKDYLDYSAYSRSGLIDQLKYEGFTTEQATYGVNQTGL
ncbi:Ltp family lipoprotein [Nocardioides sp. WL0053]|uniref:Ltp family lipoprotein n=1 Tax=Nocardioides jiangsuensis TaxID=2866161 RepID=A0ABS7RFA0_9ACTN|nr:Ltp family lipoprotein [Nocardioides jiangsuensis]MBY9073436.1 Ltp family lipoprotein [Nocardioides jiangsuensis]